MFRVRVGGFRVRVGQIRIVPRGVPAQTARRSESRVCSHLALLCAVIEMRAAGQHTLGLTYEDFLSNFAKAEGGLAGEFFTPYIQQTIETRQRTVSAAHDCIARQQRTDLLPSNSPLTTLASAAWPGHRSALVEVVGPPGHRSADGGRVPGTVGKMV